MLWNYRHTWHKSMNRPCFLAPVRHVLDVLQNPRIVASICLAVWQTIRWLHGSISNSTLQGYTIELVSWSFLNPVAIYSQHHSCNLPNCFFLAILHSFLSLSLHLPADMAYSLAFWESWLQMCRCDPHATKSIPNKLRFNQTQPIAIWSCVDCANVRHQCPTQSIPLLPTCYSTYKQGLVGTSCPKSGCFHGCLLDIQGIWAINWRCMAHRCSPHFVLLGVIRIPRDWSHDNHLQQRSWEPSCSCTETLHMLV